MAGTEFRIRVWRSDDLQYRGRETDEHLEVSGTGFVNARVVDKDVTDSCTAGYAQFRRSKVKFTEAADEILFVLGGQVTIAHGQDSYVAQSGDIVFIPRGISISMEGDQESKVAYVSNICAP